MSCDADPAYEQLLKGKRVVVVGPSRTTLGTRHGRAIDSYDIVVRFNDAIEHMPFTGHGADDLGMRADIIYCNQVFLKRIIGGWGIGPERLVSACDRAGVKYFTCTNNSLSFARTGEPNPQCRDVERNLTSDFETFRRRHVMGPALRVVYAASELLTKWLQGNFGRTGFIAIADLLSFEISHLHVTGMTFYHGGGHLFPESASDLHPLKNRDGTWARDLSGLGHNSYLELEVMRVLARCYRDRLTVDQPLQDLLGCG
jgi:hypothetical protein